MEVNMEKENTQEVSYFESLARIPVRLVMEEDKRLVITIEMRRPEMSFRSKSGQKRKADQILKAANF